MKEDIIQKYQKEFQDEIFKEIDVLFPDKNKEREKVLLLSVVLIIKFQKILKQIT